MGKITDVSKLAPGIQSSQVDFLSRTRVVKSPWMQRILTFLMVFGPGLIAMEADNDAGAVSTYTQAGAQYGLPQVQAAGGRCLRGVRRGHP
jgi:hypothetical protein